MGSISVAFCYFLFTTANAEPKSMIGYNTYSRKDSLELDYVDKFGTREIANTTLIPYDENRFKTRRLGSKDTLNPFRSKQGHIIGSQNVFGLGFVGTIGLLGITGMVLQSRQTTTLRHRINSLEAADLSLNNSRLPTIESSLSLVQNDVRENQLKLNTTEKIIKGVKNKVSANEIRIEKNQKDILGLLTVLEKRIRTIEISTEQNEKNIVVLLTAIKSNFQMIKIQSRDISEFCDLLESLGGETGITETNLDDLVDNDYGILKAEKVKIRFNLIEGALLNISVPYCESLPLP